MGTQEICLETFSGKHAVTGPKISMSVIRLGEIFNGWFQTLFRERVKFLNLDNPTKYSD